MSKKKSSVTQMLSSLLDKMQNRISDVANRSAVNSDQIAELDNKIDAVTTNSAKGFVEQKQAIADNAAGTSYALESLKTSTQRAFDGVSNDIKSAAASAQRHNARISKLEGGTSTTAIELVGIRCQQMAFDDRLARLESKATPSPSNTTASLLEKELKEVLQRFGYDVTSVGVSKSDYTGIAGVVGVRGILSSSQQRGSQHIEIKLSGYKSL